MSYTARGNRTELTESIQINIEQHLVAAGIEAIVFGREKTSTLFTQKCVKKFNFKMSWIFMHFGLS